jgi:hypothetical protein
VVPGNFMTASLWNANVFNGLTFLLSKPIFQGHQATSQTVSGTATALTIDTGDIDTYNGHSNTSNSSRYVGQVPGYYKVWGGYAAGGLSSQTYCLAYAAKNGTEVTGSRVTDVSNSSHSYAINTNPVVVFLNGTTDYVEIYGATDGSGSTHTGLPASSMMAEWIHA